MTEGANPNEVKSVHRAVQILEFIHDNEGARLGQLAEDLDVSRSTIHNHLATLKRMGYLVKQANTYHLGLQFLHLGEYTRHRKPAYSLAHQKVNNLASDLNEEVDFTVPEHGRMISLYHSVGDQMSSGLQVGRWFHMHDTAAGKAALAEMDDDEVEAIIDQWGLPAKTDNTITDPDMLFEALEVVRERGYAINDQELLDGYHSVGVAVKGPDEQTIGALTVGGPTYRIRSSLESADLLDTLFDTVEELQRDIATAPADEANWWRERTNRLQK